MDLRFPAVSSLRFALLSLPLFMVLPLGGCSGTDSSESEDGVDSGVDSGFDSMIADSRLADTGTDSGTDTALPDTRPDVAPDTAVDASDAADATDATDVADATDASCSLADAGGDAATGTSCSGACVDTSSDPAHCGTCTRACDSGQTCGSGTCSDVAVSLAGLRWELPCLSDLNPQVCVTNSRTTLTASLAGVTGVTYHVTLHFRGVVETKAYSGGSDDGAFFQTGGAPVADDWNIYELDVATPAQTFFLNKGTSGLYNVWKLDYTKTIDMMAGATITLTADPVDGGPYEIKNLDTTATPIVVDGVPPAPAAFVGQFIQMDVVSVVAAP